MTAPAFDLLDASFYVDGARESYAWLRRNAPIYHDTGSGLWALSTYADVRAAGRDVATFSSAGGSRPDTGPLPWMIDLDPPDHHKRRKLVSRGFTPARVRGLAERIARICDDLIDRVREQGTCDVVRDIAAPLPMTVIGDMLGVPSADHALLLRCSDDMLASLNGGPENLQRAAAAFGEFFEYAGGMIAARRAEPADDMVSVLVHAEVDGDRLDENEIVFESLLLLLGGDETTRNVTGGGMAQLLASPGEKQKLLDDQSLVEPGVDEMLRWVSPIKNMNRTLTRDVTLHDVQLPAGDKVLLLYESANFDELQFPEPERFDVERSPNDHVAFGFGEHFCLGANLARLELRTVFERVLQRLPDMELATDEPLPRSITGLAALPVRFRPTPKRLAG